MFLQNRKRTLNKQIKRLVRGDGEIENNSKDTYPVAIWELTLKCNLKCKHCVSSAGKARTDELSTEEVLKLCRDLSDLGFKAVCLMGGELFLRRDWYTIGKEIKDLGMGLSIVTNGFCNKEDIIPKLIQLETACITFSIDGTPETHDHIRGFEGSFNKAIEFMRSVKKAGLPTNIITTVHKLNFNDIPKMAYFLLEKEEVEWQIQEASPIGRFTEERILSKEEAYYLATYIAFLQQKYSKEKVFGSHSLGFNSNFIPNLSLASEWQGCHAGKKILGIKSNGDVIGCLMLSDEFIEGNVRKRSIKDIWNDPKSFSYNRQFEMKDLGDNCKDCRYGKKCKGGCTTRSFLLTGKNHNDPHCFYKIEKESISK